MNITLNNSRSILWCLLPLLMLASSYSYSQEEAYYVVHVKGQVTYTSSKKNLKVGDVINGADKISYNPEKSSAILMSTKKGRFSLSKPTKNALTSTGEFIAFVKNTLVPTSSVGNLSTRGTITPPCTDNLKMLLGTEAFIFPDDKAVICVDQNSYPLNENHFFIYRGFQEGKPVNLMIPFSGDSLFFEKEKLHIPSEDTVTRTEIYYYDKQQNSSIKITGIHPVYVKADDLKAESKFLIQFYKKQKLTHADILDHLLEHVQEAYQGRTDVHMLERWLKMKKLL